MARGNPIQSTPSYLYSVSVLSRCVKPKSLNSSIIPLATPISMNVVSRFTSTISLIWCVLHSAPDLRLTSQKPGPDAFKIVPDSGLVVARHAYKNNQSTYTIDGRNTTYTEVQTLLKGRGIDLDHKRFLILQVCQSIEWVDLTRIFELGRSRVNRSDEIQGFDGA